MDEESREFLLEEYKAAWEMVKYLSQQRDKWMKYYFTIVAAIFSYIGFTLKTSYEKIPEINQNSSLYDILQQTVKNNILASISIIFLLILLLIIGVLTFLATIYWRKQSTEYYNALNTFRNFFKTKNLDVSDYIILRTDKKEAFAKEGVDFYTSLMIGIVNIVILSLLIIVIVSYFVSSLIWWLILIGIIFLIAGSIFHIYKYRRILKE